MTEEIEHAFERDANKEIAEQQSVYMKNKFSFYGLKAPIRKEIQRPFLLRSTFLLRMRHLLL